jgi:hypothetical protein
MNNTIITNLLLIKIRVLLERRINKMEKIFKELTYEELLTAHDDFIELHTTGILKENTIGRLILEKSKEFYYGTYAVSNMIIHGAIMEEILKRQKDRTCKNCKYHFKYGCPMRHKTSEHEYCNEFILENEEK